MQIPHDHPHDHMSPRPSRDIYTPGEPGGMASTSGSLTALLVIVALLGGLILLASLGGGSDDVNSGQSGSATPDTSGVVTTAPESGASQATQE